MNEPYDKPVTVSKDLRRQFREEGYFILENAMSGQQIEDLRSEAARFMQLQDEEHARHGVGPKDINQAGVRYFIGNKHKIWGSEKLERYIYSNLMAEICRATIGDTAYLFNEQYVIKAGEKGTSFAWHQDSGYIGHPHKPYLTVWSPLDDVTEENGTVYILPYSIGGRPQLVQHQWQEGSSDFQGYFGDHPGIPVICPAGSIAVFSSLTFHRSGANTTSRPRRVYLTQYSSEPITNQDGTALWQLADPFLQAGERVVK